MKHWSARDKLIVVLVVVLIFACVYGWLLGLLWAAWNFLPRWLSIPLLGWMILSYCWQQVGRRRKVEEVQFFWGHYAVCLRGKQLYRERCQKLLAHKPDAMHVIYSLRRGKISRQIHKSQTLAQAWVNEKVSTT